MSLEIFPKPASEVIAERKQRAEDQQDDAVLSVLSEQLNEVTPAESLGSEPEMSIPYEMQVGEPTFKPQLEARPPLHPGVPNPAIAPESSYPKPPPQTL
jgi:hypothetical protein